MGCLNNLATNKDSLVAAQPNGFSAIVMRAAGRTI